MSGQIDDQPTQKSLAGGRDASVPQNARLVCTFAHLARTLIQPRKRWSIQPTQKNSLDQIASLGLRTSHCRKSPMSNARDCLCFGEQQLWRIVCMPFATQTFRVAARVDLFADATLCALFSSYEARIAHVTKHHWLSGDWRAFVHWVSLRLKSRTPPAHAQVLEWVRQSALILKSRAMQCQPTKSEMRSSPRVLSLQWC